MEPVPIPVLPVSSSVGWRQSLTFPELGLLICKMKISLWAWNQEAGEERKRWPAGKWGNAPHCGHLVLPHWPTALSPNSPLSSRPLSSPRASSPTVTKPCPQLPGFLLLLRNMLRAEGDAEASLQSLLIISGKAELWNQWGAEAPVPKTHSHVNSENTLNTCWGWHQHLLLCNINTTIL